MSDIVKCSADPGTGAMSWDNGHIAGLTVPALSAVNRHCADMVTDMDCYYGGITKLKNVLNQIVAYGKKSTTQFPQYGGGTLDAVYKAAHLAEDYAEMAGAKPASNLFFKVMDEAITAHILTTAGVGGGRPGTVGMPPGLDFSNVPSHTPKSVCKAYQGSSQYDVAIDSGGDVLQVDGAVCHVRMGATAGRLTAKTPASGTPQTVKERGTDTAHGQITAKDSPFMVYPGNLRPPSAGKDIPAGGGSIDYANKQHGNVAESIAEWTTGSPVKSTPHMGTLMGGAGQWAGDTFSDKKIIEAKLKALKEWTDYLLGPPDPPSGADKTNLDAINALIATAQQLMATPALTTCADGALEDIREIQDWANDSVGVHMTGRGGGGSPAQNAALAAAAAAAAGAHGGAVGSLTIQVSRDIKYKEQCILLSQIATLAQYRRNLDLVAPTVNRRLPYVAGGSPNKTANAPLVVDGESFGFMNKLTQYAGMKDFFDMTNAEIAGLQPLIRLYKIRGAHGDAAVSEREIYFDSYAKKDDVADIFENKNKRGFGIGIKDFKISYEGQDLFAQKKSIRATLKLQANSFSELLKDRGGYRYIDLALKTGTSVKEKRPELDELNFRLKAVFGWTPIKNTILRPEVETALNGTYVSVNLTPVTHNFDFDDMGRVTFTIEYFAYVDDFYDKPRMNIFTHSETYAKILVRKIAYESASQDAKCDADEKTLREKIAKSKKADADKIVAEKVSMLKHLFAELFKDKKIYFLNLSRAELTEIIKLGPHYEFTPHINPPGQALSTALQSNLSDAWKQQFASASGPDKKSTDALEASLLLGGIDSLQIPFFYIGDLLDQVLGNMAKFLDDTQKAVSTSTPPAGIVYNEEIKNSEINTLKKSIEEFEKFRVVMGPLEIVDHKNNSVTMQNFSDVPVSVSYVSEWLTSKLLKKDQAIYPLTQFLKDLFNDLIKKFLNDDTCYDYSIKQKVRLFQSVVTSYPNKTTQIPDEITAFNKNQPGHRTNIFKINNKTPFLNISGLADFGHPNPGGEMNYFIFFAGRTQPLDLMNGKRSQDEDRGIFHYLLGKDRGIVKTIQLNKTSSPGLKEVRFEQEGYDGLAQLREIYDVSIDTYANIRAFPGNYIFVDPRGFDPSLVGFTKDGFDLTDLGVGGYYMIIRSEHEFGPGRANTNLTAVWVASAASDDDNRLIEESIGSNNKTKAKCSRKRAADAKARLGTAATGTDPLTQQYTGNKVQYPSATSAGSTSASGPPAGGGAPPPQGPPNASPGGLTCFVAGTKITMGDGSKKNIEDISIGDVVLTSAGIHPVIGLDPTVLGTRKLYSFNGTENYFVTSEHPFMTSEGWKSIAPSKTKQESIELYECLVGALTPGDKLVTESGLMEIESIESVEYNSPEMPLYNFHVEVAHEYFADGALVHNKTP